MLAIAVNGDQNVVVMSERVVERRSERRAVTAILGVGDNGHVAPRGEKLRRAVVRTIVNDQDIARMSGHLVENRFDMRRFVVDRKCGEVAG